MNPKKLTELKEFLAEQLAAIKNPGALGELELYHLTVAGLEEQVAKVPPTGGAIGYFEITGQPQATFHPYNAANPRYDADYRQRELWLVPATGEVFPFCPECEGPLLRDHVCGVANVIQPAADGEEPIVHKVDKCEAAMLGRRAHQRRLARMENSRLVHQIAQVVAESTAIKLRLGGQPWITLTAQRDSVADLVRIYLSGLAAGHPQLRGGPAADFLELAVKQGDTERTLTFSVGEMREFALGNVVVAATQAFMRLGTLGDGELARIREHGFMDLRWTGTTR